MLSKLAAEFECLYIKRDSLSPNTYYNSYYSSAPPVRTLKSKAELRQDALAAPGSPWCFGNGELAVLLFVTAKRSA